MHVKWKENAYYIVNVYSSAILIKNNFMEGTLGSKKKRNWKGLVYWKGL